MTEPPPMEPNVVFQLIVGFEIEQMARGLRDYRANHDQLKYEAALVHYRLLVEFFVGTVDSKAKSNRRSTDLQPRQLAPDWPEIGVPEMSRHLVHPVNVDDLRSGVTTLNRWLMHLTSDRIDPDLQVIAFGAFPLAVMVLGLAADFEWMVREAGIVSDPLALRTSNRKAWEMLRSAEPHLVEMLLKEPPDEP